MVLGFRKGVGPMNSYHQLELDRNRQYLLRLLARSLGRLALDLRLYGLERRL